MSAYSKSLPPFCQAGTSPSLHKPLQVVWKNNLTSYTQKRTSWNVREIYYGLHESTIWECAYTWEIQGSVLVAHLRVLTKPLVSYTKYIYFMLYMVLHICKMWVIFHVTNVCSMYIII